MALKGRMGRIILNVSFLALDISLFLYLGFPSSSGTIGSKQPSHVSSLQVTEIDNEAGIVSSVSFEDSLVLPIVQQPQGETNYVSSNAGEVTQFSSASQYGNVGLLAHNFLSGKSFSHLIVGQEIHLQYEDGNIENFVVTEILSYQALDPRNPFSSFQNLNNKKEVLSAQEMFERVYEGNHHITFQTCIARNGVSSWGRLFVVAVPEVPSLSIAP